MIATIRHWGTRLRIGRALLLAIGAALLIGFVILIVNLALGQLGCPYLFGLIKPFCGTHIGWAMSFSLIMVPFAIHFTFRRPWVFPGALYAFLLPSDSYLNLTSGSSLTKIAAIMASGALIWMILRNRRVVKPGAATAVWIAYFLLNSLSLLWLYNPQDNPIPWQIYFTLAQLVIAYLVFVVAPIDESDFNVILIAFMLGSCAAALFGAHVFAQAQASGTLNQGRLKTHFDTDNHLSSDIFAASLVLPLGMAVMWALRTKSWVRKIPYVIAFGTLIIGQYAVASRGAILADCVAIGYFFWKSRYRAQLAFVASCGLIVSFIFPTALWARFFNPHDTGGSGRIEIWKVGLAALKANWLHGTGVATFPIAYNHYFLTVFNAFYTNWNRAPHDILLEAGVELGVGGALLLTYGWYVTYASLRHIPKTDPLWDTRLIMEGGILATFVAALFVGIMFEKFAWWDFALVGMLRNVTLNRLQPAGSVLLVGDAMVTPLQEALPAGARASIGSD